MRKIVVPQDVNIKTGTVDNRGEPIVHKESFAEFLHDSVLSRMGTKLKDTRRNLKLYDKFIKADPNTEIKIDNADWDAMMDALKGDWNQFLAMQVLPFFDAIENAEEIAND